ncbi:MAG: hypothetical protein KAR64_04710 [Thermoplasmatales archaeon]|nr:hypothetical protein [Thermoplasmatales archaeon]
MNEGMNDDFLDSIFNYAVVIRAEFSTIQELKQYIAEKRITVRFQKLSTNFLEIKEGNHG